MKMEIERIRGCVADSLTINGEEEKDLYPETRKAYRVNICNWLKNNENKISTAELLDFVLETAGDYDCSDEPCACCGDLIETYKLKI